MTKHKHAHKYYRTFTNKNRIIRWHCSMPSCYHYVYTEAVLGRRTICWKCDLEFTLPTRESDMLAKPVCPECLDRRKRKLNGPLLDLIRETQGEEAVQDFLDKESERGENWFEKIPDEIVQQAHEGSKDAISAILKEAFESINKV